MPELVDLFVKTYGIIGLVFLAPYVAAVYLWKDNRALHKEVVAKTELASAVQALRVEDAKQISEKLIEIVSENTSQARETVTAMDRVREMIVMRTPVGDRS